MTAKECKLEIVKRYPEKKPSIKERLKGNQLVNWGFDQEGALREAQRCLGNTRCESCNLCRLLCPDLAITRNENTGEIEIDYDYCKGCGICALVCPKGAIEIDLPPKPVEIKKAWDIISSVKGASLSGQAETLVECEHEGDICKGYIIRDGMQVPKHRSCIYRERDFLKKVFSAI